VAKSNRVAQEATSEKKESLIGAFFRGFILPIKLIGKGFAWISHQPPLKQIGHVFRAFARLRVVRFIGKLLGLGYFRDSARELKQVTWPSWVESRRLTGAVMLFSVIFGALIASVDYGLDKLFKQVLLK
jgi:preprotein translocase SecE subunit